MARIACLGSSLQDIYLIDRDDLTSAQIGDEAIFNKLLLGTKVDIERISFEVGGGGVNASISFARHGHETILLSNIAHDSSGMAVLKTLSNEGIDSGYLNFLGRKATGTSVILLDPRSGERTILTYRGASKEFSNLQEEDLDLIQPDWLYTTTLRGDIDTLHRFFAKAKSLGTKIMFNPGKKELEQRDGVIKLLKFVDILNVNKEEAAQLVSGGTLEELLSRLNTYVKTVIITDGGMGSIAGDGEERYRVGLYEVIDAKDTTGAGDAFGSGFLAHLASGCSFKNSLVFAAANSASVVSKLGANKGILTDKEKLHPMPIQKI